MMTRKQAMMTQVPWQLKSIFFLVFTVLVFFGNTSQAQQIINPGPGSTLPGATVTFHWTDNGANVTQYWMYVGTSVGAANLHSSGSLGTNTSHTVTGLPLNSSPIHVRLWFRINNGGWQSNDSSYTAASLAPQITSPGPGSTLPGATVTFHWTDNGANVTQYWMYVGTSVGAANLHSSGSLGTNTSHTVTGLPLNSSPIHVRLWFRINNGGWQSNDSSYTAASLAPQITSPGPGSTLPGATVTFHWTDNGANVTQYWMYVGTSVGAANLHSSGSLGTNTSHTVTGLPLNSSPIHVRLWFRINNGGWQSNDFSYTAGTVNCTTDSDGDRLADCYETNTGVFVSPTDTGTDPNEADTDADGIEDGDEVLGTTAGLDLPGMGSNPLKKNILLEYDWFDDSLDCAAHSHRPTQAMLNRVTTAFANAPVPNPDGSTGITVIHDRGQGGLFTGGNLINDIDGVLTGGVNSPEFQNHKTANFTANRHGYFHYVILPHRYNTSSGSSGQAELPGDDLIVSLYCSNSEVNVANTIVHELGHNLNLRHGGNENCNYKPNYNSVMNYKYQFPGVDDDCTPPGNGVLDYSFGNRITLNENALNENLGTCGAGSPWDWNGNGVIQNPVAFDINSQGNTSCGGTNTVLSDHDDWGNLFFQGIGDADGAVASQEIIDCTNAPPSN